MNRVANPERGSTHRFTDRVVLVVGGGLDPNGWSNGAAAAVSYAGEGAMVAVMDLSLNAAQATVDAIKDQNGAAAAFVGNVTDLMSIETAVSEVIAMFGQIDVLHNNVGSTIMGGPVELTEAQFQTAIDLNLGSVFRTAKAVIPHMLTNGSGAIVNISSLASIRYTGYPYFAYYAAKAGVNHATVALAMEYARRNIRANCIAPGMIDTPLVHREIADQYESVKEMNSERQRNVPLGILGDPWDVARASLFLASDDARFITGVCLPVDGGQSCATQPLA